MATWALTVLVLAAGCSPGASLESSDDESEATAVEGSGSTDATDPAPTSSSTGEPGTTNNPTADTEGAEVGPNFGLLTFTFYPADAAGAPAQLGMAGAWRSAAFTTDDFYAVRALGAFFPRVPDAADTLEHSGPAVYDWGFGDTWVRLGNGMRLGDALACLQPFKTDYPVYVSDDADNLDPACAPDLAHWQPGADYALTVYGGEDYADQAVPDAITTPTALTVTAPDVATFDLPLDHTQDLEVAWTADGGPGDRVVIRLWDQFGELITVLADDDGGYTIPAADLAELSLGAVTLAVAREHVNDVGLAPGTLRIVARHEVWAYPDLF